MKLYLNKTSPYARLTLVTAHEAGLNERIEKVWIEPWDDAPRLLAVNPLSRVPALETDDGVALIESSCICDYMIALSRQDWLMPSSPAPRQQTLRRLGLGRAVIDCAFGAVIQRRFNDGAATALAQRWLQALPRATTVLEQIYRERAAPTAPDLGDLAVAVAYSYVEFRLPEISWRQQAPGLTRFLDGMNARPSMTLTDPR